MIKKNFSDGYDPSDETQLGPSEKPRKKRKFWKFFQPLKVINPMIAVSLCHTIWKNRKLLMIAMAMNLSSLALMNRPNFPQPVHQFSQKRWSKLEKELDKIKDQRDLKTEELKDVRDELKKTSRENKEFFDVYTAQDKRITYLEKQVETYQVKLEQKDYELDQSENRLSKMKQKNRALQDLRNQDFRKREDFRRGQIDQMKKTMANNRLQLDQFKNQLNQRFHQNEEQLKSMKIEMNNAKVEQSERKYQEIKGEYDQLQEENNRLKEKSLKTEGMIEAIKEDQEKEREERERLNNSQRLHQKIIAHWNV